MKTLTQKQDIKLTKQDEGSR